MRVKNISNKVISVGSVAILPGKTQQITGYEKNKVISSLVKTKYLVILRDPPPRRGR